MHARFCPACGTQITRSDAADQEMLKIVTILFADVVSSTQRGEQMHPEDVRALMSEFFSSMSEAIRHEGGTVEKFIGDAVMAVFGVPTTREDDPLRAVRSARRMLERLRVFNANRDPISQLQVRIGINTGEVIAASTPGQDLLVTGDAVNVAARLQQLADPGSILVGERTARAVRGCWHVRPIDGLEVAGKSEHVSAFVIAGEDDTMEPRGVPGLSAPMVGREPEMVVLRTLYERMQRERSPHLVTVLGDAGVGKSRLIQEFITSLDSAPKVLGSRCPPYGEGLTLWPLGKILKSEAGIFDSDSSELTIEKVAKLVASLPTDLVAQPDVTIGALARTIGLEPDGTRGGRDPRQVYRDLLNAWKILLTAITPEDGVIVIIEDIHWADQMMLDVLTELSEQLGASVLFLCTARPDLLRDHSAWGGGRRNYSSVSLDPLTADESRRLMAALLEAENLDDSLRDRILRRAEGNPFFLEEIIRNLIDNGALVNQQGTWTASSAISEVEIPDDVQAVILARIDLLDVRERGVMQQAGVVGRTFWLGALKRLTGIEELEEILRNLQQREFIAERLTSSVAGEREFSFKHILIRDVAYQSLPRRTRGEAHATVARWIEMTAGNRFQERAELLAHHYRKAHMYLSEDEYRVAARTYCMAASMKAFHRAAFKQAEWYGRRAVDLSVGVDERIEALEAVGDTYIYGEDAYRAYQEAIDKLTSKRPDDGEALGRLTAKAVVTPSRYRGSMLDPPPPEETMTLLRRGLEVAGPQDRVVLLASITFLQAMGFPEGDGEGVRSAEEALRIARELDDPGLQSVALDAIASAHMCVGRFGEARRIHLQRIELLPPDSDVSERCDAYGGTAWCSTVMGRYTEAVDYAGLGVELAADVHPAAQLHCLSWRMQARFMLGDWDGALADQATIEALQEDTGTDVPIPYTMRAYATALLIHELRGEDSAVTEYFDLLGRYRSRSTTAKRMGHSPVYVARALCHAGDVEQAAEELSHQKASFAALHPEATFDIIAARRRWDEVADAVAIANELSEKGELEALEYFANRLEGRSARARGDCNQAEELLRRSVEGFERVGARWEQVTTAIDLAETLIELGREEEASSLLGTALVELRRLRSVSEIERAERLAATL